LIKILGVTKTYESNSTKIVVFKNLSLSFSDNCVTTILGPNACGKSTLLFLIAKILSPDSGEISSGNGKDHTELNSIGLQFQDSYNSLLPWRSVFGNIVFPLEAQTSGKSTQKIKVDSVLEMFNLIEEKDKKLYQLSGGNRQKVAIAQIVAFDPSIILLDEPFNSFDYTSRIQAQISLREYFVNKKKTVILVTHNLEEAIFMSDRIIYLSKLPARVVADIELADLRKRTYDFQNSDCFLNTRKRLINIIGEEEKI